MRKLIVVDVQKQFNSDKHIYWNCIDFVNNCAKYYDEVIATVFSQEVDGTIHQSFINKLAWHGCMHCDSSDLEFRVPGMRVLKKNTYGCTELLKYLRKGDSVDIIGCDIDVCVLAICFQLWDAGIDFRVMMDYVYTSPNGVNRNIISELIIRNFGKDSCYWEKV